MVVKNRKKIIKWIYYVIFGIFLFCLQTSPAQFPLFKNVIYILPFAISLSCYERSAYVSAIAGAVCGLFWDYSAQRFFGYNAVITCIMCIFAYVMIEFVIRPVYLSVASVCAVSSVLYCLLDFLFFSVIKGERYLGKIFVQMYIPMMIKTIIVSAIISYVVKLIYSLNPKKSSFDAN